MKSTRICAALVAPLAAGALFLAASPAPAAPPASGNLVTAVTGTVGGLAQTGTLAIEGFTNDGGALAAVGDLALGGTNLGSVTAPVDMAATTATCEILHLELGPLDLDLLGLVIHLDKVVLDISAEQAPGNLLGNLLCAVAHLLDGPALGGVTALLNRILDILQGLDL